MTPRLNQPRRTMLSQAASIALVWGAVMGSANAWVLNLTPGTRNIYLGVGNSTANAANATINVVSVTVPANALGTGTVQTMSSNSTQANSPYDGYTVCVPPAQVYIGGSYRQPATTASTAVLQVTTPANLTNGTDTIPFSEISWTSTALGNTTPDIPAGTFTGATISLRNIASNTYVENCHTFSYANSAIRPPGTYSGRATYTLTAP